MADHPPYNVPWAAEGEARPSHFRVPLAHADGHDGGVLYVRDGHSTERWVSMRDWRAWVGEHAAKPVIDDRPDVPWEEADLT